MGGSRRGWTADRSTRRSPRPLASVETSATERTSSGIGELDRVLGGGLVPGELILIGGDPGIGKSTLALQAAQKMAAAGSTVLYVSGEESEEQVRLRASRLDAVPEQLLVLCETDLEAVLEAAAQVAPAMVVIDSIQTMSRAELEGGAGSVTQVRECGLALLHHAKSAHVPVLLLGHVTKDGSLAGPRVLEHMVDAVLYLEGERYRHYRILRGAKNRFGATHELGVFEMTDRGLLEVANPSGVFLSDSSRLEPGSAVVASLEGSRPFLVEVQALVSSSFYATPQRVSSGFDPRRLSVLLAVLERRVGLKLGRHDVFVTVTGGFTLEEPGADLGVAMALASSFKSRPLLNRSLLVGEVALSGELRRATRLSERLKEARQLGFERAAVPAAQVAEARDAGVEVVAIRSLREGFEQLLGPRQEADAAPRRPQTDPERVRS